MLITCGKINPEDFFENEIQTTKCYRGIITFFSFKVS